MQQDLHIGVTPTNGAETPAYRPWPFMRKPVVLNVFS